MPVDAAVTRQIQVATVVQAVVRALGFRYGSAPMHLNADGHFGWMPKVGDRVRIKPQHRWPGLVDDVFEVATTVGSGQDAMHTVTAADGKHFKWLRTTELMPDSQEDSMNAIDQASKSKDTAAAVKALRADDLTSYLREFNVGGCNDAVAEPVVSLSAKPGESFDALAQQIARDRGISLREAIHAAGIARPDLAASR